MKLLKLNNRKPIKRGWGSAQYGRNICSPGQTIPRIGKCRPGFECDQEIVCAVKFKKENITFRTKEIPSCFTEITKFCCK